MRQKYLIIIAIFLYTSFILYTFHFLPILHRLFSLLYFYILAILL